MQALRATVHSESRNEVTEGNEGIAGRDARSGLFTTNDLELGETASMLAVVKTRMLKKSAAVVCMRVAAQVSCALVGLIVLGSFSIELLTPPRWSLSQPWSQQMSTGSSPQSASLALPSSTSHSLHAIRSLAELSPPSVLLPPPPPPAAAASPETAFPWLQVLVLVLLLLLILLELVCCAQRQSSQDQSKRPRAARYEDLTEGRRDERGRLPEALNPASPRRNPGSPRKSPADMRLSFKARSLALNAEERWHRVSLRVKPWMLVPPQDDSFGRTRPPSFVYFYLVAPGIEPPSRWPDGWLIEGRSDPWLSPREDRPDEAFSGYNSEYFFSAAVQHLDVYGLTRSHGTAPIVSVHLAKGHNPKLVNNVQPGRLKLSGNLSEVGLPVSRLLVNFGAAREDPDA